MSGSAWAQLEERPLYAEEPTGGVLAPTNGIAGETDALTVSTNPAGLQFLPGPNVVAVLHLDNEDEVSTAGQGLGFFAAGTFGGGGLLPRVGYGIGLEFLEPTRLAVEPDPGSPFRLTLANSMAVSNSVSLGLSYHRFWDARGSSLDGESTWDLGIATRFGAYLGAGFVVRDLTAPVIADTPVQRRYEGELVARPLATDRLEVGLGGRIGETRGDIDAWLRWSLRIVDGVYFRSEASTYELQRLVRSPISAASSTEEREYRLTAGFEVSFGGFGVSTFSTGALDTNENASFRGGTLVVRASTPAVPSVLGEPDRIERIELAGAMDDGKVLSLAAYMRSLETTKEVVGVLLQFDDLATGWANLQELRQRVLALRKAGKKVFSYMVAGTSAEYYLASAADKVYVDPAGGLRLVGFSGTTLFYKELFDNLGVQAQFEKIEEYKSAPEAWTRTSPSEPAWRMRNSLYDSLYAQLVAGIAEGRNLKPEQVRKLIDAGPYTSGDLERLSALVDAVGLPKDLNDLIDKELGAHFPVTTAEATRPERWAFPKVAVINIAGDIVGGKSRTIPLLGRQLVGGETIAETIAAARSTPSIRAIVLRINSPGGSALASEIISREVFKTRGVKPIICSMGDLAASGGYFAAAGCDFIFAEPMTITGSIGIFSGKFEFSRLLTKVGIGRADLARGENADMESIFAPYTDAQRELVKGKLKYYYGRFVDAVAKGRNMTSDKVNELGKGRVWTGAQAKRNGLVDELGGVMDAIRLAKARAGYDDHSKVELVVLPKAKSDLLQRLLGGGLSRTSGGAQDAISSLPWVEQLLRVLPASMLAEPDVPQARLPFAIISPQ